MNHSHSLLGFTKFLLSQPLQKAFPGKLVLTPARSRSQTGKVACIECPGGLYCCSQVMARRHTEGLCSVL
ncbi:MAG TPA: hypothetical protein V6C90_12460 [Coleofasciculaceae cyanobacterium]